MAAARRPTRRQARRRALDLLYQADLTQRSVERVLGALDPEAEDTEELPAYTGQLMRGMAAHQATIDGLIADHAEGWHLQRMPILDRNLLRLGLYEICYEPDVPDAVAIDEAVALAQELSTEASGRFVNGLLARVARERADAETTSPPSEA
ncbi:MAG: transcription antitermination factor NusB [Actinobacteria bacterium QS_8_72_14]|nr:MAG: transcription antitermination factor NusB [Actinobacteria bacterium QS_8_72_14]